MSSRRDVLSTIDLKTLSDPNAGLCLDKFIANLEREDKESRSKLAKQVARIQSPEIYGSFYKNWEGFLAEIGAATRQARIKNRLAVGLGSNGVLETSVTLNRTYGVPYIPGSAIKGLGAAFARQYCGAEWQIGQPFYRIIFGANDEAGYVTFFDALYEPGSGHDRKPLHFDVMTVHHRGYYEGKDQPPADWDDPNPVPFISATGKYLIAMAAPEGCENWRDLAFEIVERALAHEGVGGKTSSGYGRAIFDAAPVDPELTQVDQMLRRIKSIPSDKLPGELGEQVNNLGRSQLREENKRKVAQLILKRISEAGKQRKKFEEKPWFAEIKKLGGDV
jgi:CRISPR type III-B/RAMP module RAMP protein Cmr6